MAKNSITLADIHGMVLHEVVLTEVEIDGIGLQKILEDVRSLENMITEELDTALSHMCAVATTPPPHAPSSTPHFPPPLLARRHLESLPNCRL